MNFSSKHQPFIALCTFLFKLKKASHLDLPFFLAGDEGFAPQNKFCYHACLANVPLAHLKCLLDRKHFAQPFESLFIH